ncbi:hypothetical protein AB0C10_14805 [Microbispora amethystogenes]|uniref:hypothetical protein n=1 Tax=Microbispora amethystogenes TaxID=1427754 RepID=UPI0033F29563
MSRARALEKLFAADVVSSSDGDGIRGSSKFPVPYSERVARFVAAFSPWFWPGVAITWVEMTGLPGALVNRDGSGVALLTIEASREGGHHLLCIPTLKGTPGNDQIPSTDHDYASDEKRKSRDHFVMITAPTY